MDLETIWDRVNEAINIIIRRDESTETGDLLPPCVEGTCYTLLLGLHFVDCNYMKKEVIFGVLPSVILFPCARKSLSFKSVRVSNRWCVNYVFVSFFHVMFSCSQSWLCSCKSFQKSKAQ